MDAGIEKECSALGGLFQVIMNDMKVGTERPNVKKNQTNKKDRLRGRLAYLSSLVKVNSGVSMCSLPLHSCLMPNIITLP